MKSFWKAFKALKFKQVSVPIRVHVNTIPTLSPWLRIGEGSAHAGRVSAHAGSAVFRAPRLRVEEGQRACGERCVPGPAAAFAAY